MNSLRFALSGPIAALSLALLSLTACEKEAPLVRLGAPLSDAETKPFRSCQKDDDCVYVQNGCCDCANGGAELAVNKSQVDAFRALFKCGADTPCTLTAMVPPCGTGKALCISGTCTFQR